MREEECGGFLTLASEGCGDESGEFGFKRFEDGNKSKG